VRLGPEAMRQLTKLPWPGNIAQLRKVLAETVALQRSGVIGADKLPAECRSLARRRLTQLEALERDAIVRSLQENGGSKADAAEALGMSRATKNQRVRYRLTPAVSLDLAETRQISLRQVLMRAGVGVHPHLGIGAATTRSRLSIRRRTAPTQSVCVLHADLAAAFDKHDQLVNMR